MRETVDRPVSDVDSVPSNYLRSQNPPGRFVLKMTVRVPVSIRALLLAGALAVPAFAPALAQGVEDPFAQRGSGLASVIQYLQKQGISFVSLGEIAGHPGYLAADAAGKHSIVYVADDRHAVVGALYRSGGGNMTARQVGEMITRFADAAKTVGVGKVEHPVLGDEVAGEGPILDWFRGRGFEVTDITLDEGGLDAALVQTPPVDGEMQKAQVFYIVPDAPEYGFAGVLLDAEGTNITGLQIGDLRQRIALEKSTSEKGGSTISTDTNKPAAPDAAFPDAPDNKPADATAAHGSDASAYVVEGERGAEVIARLEGAHSFFVGNADAPRLFMVADPSCPFCHRAWQFLKPQVVAGDLRLDVVMIAGLRGSDVKARSILSRPSQPGARLSGPALAWMSGEGSVDNIAVKEGPIAGSDEWAEMGRKLEDNMSVMLDFDVRQTPFLAYVGADGRTYANVGLPTDMSRFLSGL